MCSDLNKAASDSITKTINLGEMEKIEHFFAHLSNLKNLLLETAKNMKTVTIMVYQKGEIRMTLDGRPIAGHISLSTGSFV
jgi:hypothetical protein